MKKNYFNIIFLGRINLKKFFNFRNRIIHQKHFLSIKLDQLYNEKVYSSIKFYTFLIDFIIHFK